MDIRETEAAALGGVSEPGVIDAELVQYGGVEIMNVDGTRSKFFLRWIDGLAVGTQDIITVIVSGTIGHARLDAAARHPSGEAARVVIPTVVILGELTLGVGGATELSAPDDKSIF